MGSPVTSPDNTSRSQSGGGEPADALGGHEKDNFYWAVSQFGEEMETGPVIFLTLMKGCRALRREVLFLQYECEQTARINQYSAQRVCYPQCAVSRDAFFY